MQTRRQRIEDILDKGLRRSSTKDGEIDDKGSRRSTKDMADQPARVRKLQGLARGVMSLANGSLEEFPEFRKIHSTLEEGKRRITSQIDDKEHGQRHRQNGPVSSNRRDVAVQSGNEDCESRRDSLYTRTVVDKIILAGYEGPMYQDASEEMVFVRNLGHGK